MGIAAPRCDSSRMSHTKNPVEVPAEVLAGTELGTKVHAAAAAKVSVRSIENLANRRAIPIVRLSARCVRFHIPSVLAALRRFEVQAVTAPGVAKSPVKLPYALKSGRQHP